MANPNGAVPERLPPMSQEPPSAVNAAQLDQLLRAVGELTNMVHSQQRQIDSLAGEVRTGVRLELGGLWTALRERDAAQQGGAAFEQPPATPPPAQAAPTGGLPQRDHQSIARAERAEAALSVKEAECETLRLRLRELEQGQRHVGHGYSLPSHHQHQRDSHAATRVQAIQRGRIDRKRMANTRGVPFRDDSAPASSAFVAKHEARSATRVQAHVRGRNARREVSQRRPQPFNDEFNRERERAATRMQAHHRGRTARRSGGSAQQRYAEAEASAMAAVEELEIAAAEAAVEALEEGEVFDEMASHNAATRVQAIQRGRNARRGQSRAAISMLGPEDDTLVGDIGLDDLEAEQQGRAATRMQAMQRGRNQRREDEQRGRAATRMQAQQRGRKTRQQHVFRGAPAPSAAMLEPDDEEEMEEEEGGDLSMEADFVRARAERENAATRVQARARGRNARRQMPTQQSSLGGAEGGSIRAVLEDEMDFGEVPGGGGGEALEEGTGDAW